MGAAAASGVAVLTNDVDTGDGVVTGGCCFFFNASWKYRMNRYTFCLFIYTFSRQYEIAIINEIRKIQVASVAKDFIIANTAISSAHFFAEDAQRPTRRPISPSIISNIIHLLCWGSANIQYTRTNTFSISNYKTEISWFDYNYFMIKKGICDDIGAEHWP